MKKKLKYVGLVLILLAVIGLVMAITNIYLVFLKPLQSGAQIDNHFGDVILVLGGGLRKGREIGYSTAERLLLAVELYKQKQRPIIISGGSMYKSSPAIKKIRRFLEDRGVKAQFVKFEGKSQTTYDHFLNTRNMILAMDAKEVIVCTSPYHQERAGMILRYLNFNNYKVAYMSKSEIFQSNSLRQRMRNLRLIFREYMAILKFKLFTK
jgi:uncharacterized SAM-binding protein YcdF (DUF218 family)